MGISTLPLLLTNTLIYGLISCSTLEPLTPERVSHEDVFSVAHAGSERCRTDPLGRVHECHSDWRKLDPGVHDPIRAPAEAGEHGRHCGPGGPVPSGPWPARDPSS